MDSIISSSIFWLQQHTSAEMLTVLLFVLCAAVILALLKFYGVFGLYVYNALAVVIANIQVLRFAQYTTCSDPIALGTVVFTTTFFVNDLITEHYGVEYAKKSVTLGFWAQVLVTAWMVLTLGHPLPELANANLAVVNAHDNYTAMLQLFTPSLRILVASLVAFMCSQWLDILIFNRIRVMTNGRFVWLRQNIAMFISGLFDTFLFSFLAWMCLSTTAITWRELVFTYVFSSQILRFILNVAFTPLMYMSYNCVSNKSKIRIYDNKERATSF